MNSEHPVSSEQPEIAAAPASAAPVEAPVAEPVAMAAPAQTLEPVQNTPAGDAAPGVADAGKGAATSSDARPPREGGRGRRDRRGRGGEKPKWDPASYVVPEIGGKVRFLDFGLHQDLIRGIADLQFQYCTPIQAETLPLTLAGVDLIGQAQTGTGKTAAFLITAIEQMLRNPIPLEQRYASEPRVLALAPTRELALQIAKDAEALTRHSGHSVVTVLGGMNYDRQREQLRNEVVDILVATPGRLLDFLGSQDVYLDQVDILILDEADRMLDMGFIPDVKRIIRKCTPKEQRQTLLFSATFNQDVLNLASMWTRAAEFVEIEPEQKTAERVKQTVYMVSEDDKVTVLYNALKQEGVSKAIIFANRRDQSRDLDETLRKLGVKSALLSGEIPQNKRLRTLDQFKSGEINVLVATDVAGRGIHVDGITHVFNFNLPENPEDYVHRIGRTGRAGEHGISISFASEDDAFVVPEIEKYIAQKLDCKTPDADLMAAVSGLGARPERQRRRPRPRAGNGRR